MTTAMVPQGTAPSMPSNAQDYAKIEPLAVKLAKEYAIAPSAYVAFLGVFDIIVQTPAGPEKADGNYSWTVRVPSTPPVGMREAMSYTGRKEPTPLILVSHNAETGATNVDFFDVTPKQLTNILAAFHEALGGGKAAA